ncbi:hypothetical protein POV26_03570 [Aequorivita todarodis]|uniref:hypothetical protein n=1 Tax=Aequorivita todarodis TaxID=2036821 RepID=UPI00234FCD33|nr:hypothetical protein [Aequorivita todarodis]MDC8000102.1 hypothetical protein [Aequorivita todarodis]
MKTEITKFWNYFLSIQMDLVYANNTGNLELSTDLINRLQCKAKNIHSELTLVFQFSGGDFAKLIFITKGKYKLNAIVKQMLVSKPQLAMWQYQIGIKQYKRSITSLCKNNNFIDQHTVIHQIYFAVHKLYKTSNKLHLLIYIEMDKKHSKSDLHDAMGTILLWFLGDAYYQKHIGKYRIVRRKFSSIRFMPLDELKHLIHFKSFN